MPNKHRLDVPEEYLMEFSGNPSFVVAVLLSPVACEGNVSVLLRSVPRVNLWRGGWGGGEGGVSFYD